VALPQEWRGARGGCAQTGLSGPGVLRQASAVMLVEAARWNARRS
jgi:hypothetical protein